MSAAGNGPGPLDAGRSVAVEPETPPGPGWQAVLLACALPLLAVAAIVIGFKIVAPGGAATGPLAVPTVYAPAATSSSCTDLLSALPAAIGDAQARALAGSPADTAGVAAWGDPPVILRCGIPTPAELTCSASLLGVDTVDWLQVSAAGQTTYVVADRPVRIALTVPDGSGTAAIQEVSRIVAGVLPEQDVCSGGALLPVEGG